MLLAVPAVMQCRDSALAIRRIRSCRIQSVVGQATLDNEPGSQAS